MKKSYAPKDRVQLEIEQVAFGGGGVGRIEGRVVFVPYTVEGDVIEAEVKTVKKRYLMAEMKKLFHASPYRVSPQCSRFGICGGCHYQHMEYEHELAVKKRQITDAFERIGGLSSPPVEDVIGSPRVYRYRQKAQFHYHRGEKGSVASGFMEANGRRIIDIDRCELVEESINEEYGSLKMRAAAGEIYEERVTLWSGTPYKSGTHIMRRVKGRDLVVPYEGFFQANAALVDRLVDAVVEGCRPFDDRPILDCYCGSGLFALFLAPRAKRILGCDLDGAAVECARMNLERAGFDNTEFREGATEEVIRDLLRKDPFPAATAILDPPRTGCSADELEGIAELRPDKIVYVSCNPATQARDIGRLTNRGYNLITLKPFDMFPKTKHVEVVALLQTSK